MKILTIAIPTYNRANLLRTQLTILAAEVESYESECEILVSDNCSTDETKEVLEEFRSKFQSGCFEFSRNHENIGAIRNILKCINSSTASHVWVCSDDDPLDKGIVSTVLNNLRASPHLGLLFLNYSMSSVRTGEMWGQRYTLDADQEYLDGKSKFEQIVGEPWGWEALCVLTATVFRTDLAKRSILE
jgi:abequosyltransferase